MSPATSGKDSSFYGSKEFERGLSWKGSYQDNSSLPIEPLLKFDDKTVPEPLVNAAVWIEKKKRNEGTKTKEAS